MLFLTGEEEIEDVCRRIRTEAESLGEEHGPIAVYPLYSSLPPRQQQDIFKEAPPPRQPGGPPGTSIDPPPLWVCACVCNMRCLFSYSTMMDKALHICNILWRRIEVHLLSRLCTTKRKLQMMSYTVMSLKFNVDKTTIDH